MRKLLFIPALLTLIIFACTNKNPKELLVLKTESLEIIINNKGELTALSDINTGTNLMPADTTVPLLSIRIDTNIITPVSAEMKDEMLLLKYPDGIVGSVAIKEHQSHISFELVAINDSSKVELVIWGPYPTVLNKVIGETVGVVQGDDFALGLQALNVKTLGGYPWNENDCMPQIDIMDQEDYSDLSEKGKRYVLYRVEAAKPEDFGSTLQAYCRDRKNERVVQNLNHEYFTTETYDDGGVIGSKIALFGCETDKILKHIEEIELAEGLPHPMINGKWGKTNIEASSSYMIIHFSEEDIDQAIAITKQAGLKYLYHSGPFKTWGHFNLNEKLFPNGNASLKNCVDKAREQNITLGLHTLSNFISTKDPYVTPIPDQRLAKVGTSYLTRDIDASQTEIEIASPEFFNQFKNNHLKTAMVGDELIRYGSVSETEPWKLLDCQRGAFGTVANSHSKDSKISKLIDHGYKVFLSDMDLGEEMAQTLADMFNQTGLRQISFDGLEGNRSTGMGNYAESLFAKTWYDGLNDDIKTNYIADASRTTHYFWHIYTRMNWGEPWYAGFRESQTEYRLKNQEYFERNLMPAMLGWFLMKAETSIEDAEWLMARSAGFNAGFALVTDYDAVKMNGFSDEIFQKISDWEEVRMAGLFTDEQKERMKDVNNEFTLEKTESGWNLIQVWTNKFRHEKKERQPGEPLYSAFDFAHKGDDQAMGFILSASDCDISEIWMEIDNYKEVKLPVRLENGQHIKYSGGDEMYLYDKNWQLIKTIKIDPSDLLIKEGSHTIHFDCKFSKTGKEPVAKLEVRTLGKAESIVQ